MLVHTENRCISNLRIRHINSCVKRYSKPFTGSEPLNPEPVNGYRYSIGCRNARPPCLVDLSNKFCYSILKGVILIRACFERNKYDMSNAVHCKSNQ